MSDIEIALAEAVNNVVEHAYAGRSAGQITLRGRLRDRKVMLWVCDAGAPMPGGAVPTGGPACVDVPLEDLPEGGFGWFLIRTLASAVRYDRRSGMNSLALRFDLAGTREKPGATQPEPKRGAALS